MAEKVFMIALSPTMEEGTILAWKKKVGDTVKMDEPLCEVETDKASMDYLSSQEGTLLAITKDVGASAKVADVIGIIGAPGEDFAALLAESAAPAKAAAPAAAPAAASSSASSAPAAASVSPSNGRVKSSPLARKIALDKGVDIASVAGSGPGGRIVKTDVESFTPGAKPASASGGVIGNIGASGLNDDRIPVSRKRATIGKRLAESLFTNLHIYLTVSVRMDGLLDARDRINEKRKDKVGLNAFVMKILAEALKRHPVVNSSLDGDFIQYHSAVDMGLAVAQPDGLITPVVRHVESKGVTQIDEELRDLIDRARSNKLLPEEYAGASFTVSNLGSFGIEEFTSIINPPGVAIISLGTTIKTPVVADDDSIQVQRIMKATLACDHRVVDGAVGAAFLTEFKKMVEDPYSILL
jgi:pyruvate dehydrogenase E2 component (dihydrolipoamide acetyltransferase)